jgi:hypothetical protein
MIRLKALAHNDLLLAALALLVAALVYWFVLGDCALGVKRGAWEPNTPYITLYAVCPAPGPVQTIGQEF